MWNRKQVKERGKQRFSQNYWKALLAGLVLSIALGAGPSIEERFQPSKPNMNMEQDYDDFGDFGDFGDFDEIPGFNPNHNFSKDFEFDFKSPAEVKQKMQDAFTILSDKIDASLLLSALAVFAIFGFIASIIGVCIRIFLLNPLELGGRTFFLKNLKQDSELRELGAGFTGNYINGVKTLFLRDLYTFLWSLLFVIPGIIKKYEYRMIPYLLAENPGMNTNEAFAISKKMMTGEKWNAFVLDLSFIGWNLLNMLTCGILGIFFVKPYKYQTDAALYETLSSNTPQQPEAKEYESYVEVE